MRFDDDHEATSGGLANDTIYSAQTICYNTIPVALTGTLPTGGVGGYTYKWLASTTSATTGYALISGATAQGYAPAALTATHWYRRVVLSGVFTDTTAPLPITVTPSISHASNTIASSEVTFLLKRFAKSLFTADLPERSLIKRLHRSMFSRLGFDSKSCQLAVS